MAPRPPVNNDPLTHPKIIAWQLFEEKTPRNVLHFQFNPSEMEVSYSVDWEEAVMQNRFNATMFRSTKPQVFKFDMFLNDWGNHASGGSTDAPGKGRLTVEQQIAWLESMTYPRKIGNDPYSSPILIFYWRDYYQVFITDMSVKRTVFRPGGGNTKGADNPFNGTTKNPNVFTLKSEDKDTLKNVSRTIESTNVIRPNDAIRATVSITLKQWIYSTTEQLAKDEKK